MDSILRQINCNRDNQNLEQSMMVWPDEKDRKKKSKEEESCGKKDEVVLPDSGK